MNKKSILVLTLVLLHYSRCHSQFLQFLKNADQIEISAGPSLATLRDKRFDVKMTDIKIGYSTKLSFNYKLRESFYLNASFFYERKGYAKKFPLVYYYDPSKDSTNCKCTTSPGSMETSVNLDYLGFSISPKIKFKNNFYLTLGFYAGYLVKATVVEKYSWRSTNKYKATDLREWDGGITLSVGRILKIKNKETITVSINDTYGLIAIASSTNSIVLTNSLSLQIGYILKTKTE